MYRTLLGIVIVVALLWENQMRTWKGSETKIMEINDSYNEIFDLYLQQHTDGDVKKLSSRTFHSRS